MQLPPVAKDGNQIHFAFEAQAWTNCIYRNLFVRFKDEKERKRTTKFIIFAFAHINRHSIMFHIHS